MGKIIAQMLLPGVARCCQVATIIIARPIPVITFTAGTKSGKDKKKKQKNCENLLKLIPVQYSSCMSCFGLN